MTKLQKIKESVAVKRNIHLYKTSTSTIPKATLNETNKIWILKQNKSQKLDVASMCF